ncbi:hypothetical protein [Cupriavidus oxalaticus]|uniref:hypothetical protein n=1 Tax=Cupriavidus oxalaticus TaxID=96344 RepID=UPI00316E995F
MRGGVTPVAHGLLGASSLLWLVPGVRHVFEASMSLHMVLQFPLLLAAGWAMSAWVPARLAAWQARCDAHGLFSATLVTVVSAFWMIPAALDLALLDARVTALKYGSWLLAGMLLAQGWRRLSPELATFFLGNVAWMLFTAGLLYRDAEARLCVSYRFDEQIVGGNGLMAWGAIIAALAWLKLRPVLRHDNAQRKEETGMR